MLGTVDSARRPCDEVLPPLFVFVRFLRFALSRGLGGATLVLLVDNRDISAKILEFLDILAIFKFLNN
jgi:hypothetical protein